MLIRLVPANGVPDPVLVPRQKRFTTRRASFPHAAWLGQGCPHCPISLTAASRRSLVRVSVPVWGTVLSDPLPIVGSVGRHPADYLMARMPVPDRRGFGLPGMPQGGRMAYYPAFPPAVRPSGVGCIRVTHPSATLMPPKGHLPSDLHVLGLPLAFILSQDQTLRCNIVFP